MQSPRPTSRRASLRWCGRSPGRWSGSDVPPLAYPIRLGPHPPADAPRSTEGAGDVRGVRHLSDGSDPARALRVPVDQRIPGAGMSEVTQTILLDDPSGRPG